MVAPHGSVRAVGEVPDGELGPWSEPLLGPALPNCDLRQFMSSLCGLSSCTFLKEDVGQKLMISGFSDTSPQSGCPWPSSWSTLGSRPNREGCVSICSNGFLGPVYPCPYMIV